MAYAFVRMRQSNSTYSRVGNGRLYEKLKLSIRDEFCGMNNPFYGDGRFVGENNPFYGKTHSKEVLEKIRQTKLKNGSLEMGGENNPFYGKTHSNKTRQLLSEKRREPVVVIFMDGSEVRFERKKDIGKYLGVSTSMGVMLCSIKRHLWSKYKIKEILECK